MLDPHQLGSSAFLDGPSHVKFADIPHLFASVHCEVFNRSICHAFIASWALSAADLVEERTGEADLVEKRFGKAEFVQMKARSPMLLPAHLHLVHHYNDKGWSQESGYPVHIFIYTTSLQKLLGFPNEAWGLNHLLQPTQCLGRAQTESAFGLPRLCEL